METRYLIGLIACAIIASIIGYFFGRRYKKPLGDIVFETYFDEETEKPAVRCTFKLDLDIDEIVKKDYILFGVQKSQDVIEYYKAQESGQK